MLWHYTHTLDPYRRIASAEPALEIQAVALDWKWLFIYPDQHVATVNQLDIPVGRPIHISLTSATVMQSMLIPQLAGQIYAMPGMTTQLNLAASRPGVYRGENTQFNGQGFPEREVRRRGFARTGLRALAGASARRPRRWTPPPMANCCGGLRRRSRCSIRPPRPASSSTSSPRSRRPADERRRVASRVRSLRLASPAVRAGVARTQAPARSSAPARRRS